MSSWASCLIFFEGLPRSFSRSALRPLMADSSASTRRALGETTRSTWETRASACRATSISRAKRAPLAPVTARVKIFPGVAGDCI